MALYTVLSNFDFILCLCFTLSRYQVIKCKRHNCQVKQTLHCPLPQLESLRNVPDSMQQIPKISLLSVQIASLAQRRSLFYGVLTGVGEVFNLISTINTNMTTSKCSLTRLIQLPGLSYHSKLSKQHNHLANGVKFYHINSSQTSSHLLGSLAQ